MTEQINEPKLRFGGFEGEWKRFPLMSLLSKVIDYRGQSVPKAETGIPLITAKNVKKGYLDFSCAEYVDATEFEAWATRGKPKGGDVLFTTEAPLGNVCFFPADRTYAVGQRTVTLVGSKKLDNNYLLHLMLSPKVQQSIDAKASGTTAKGIKSSELKKLPVTVPVTTSEQQKIASFLSKVDEKIAFLTEKKAKITEYKKGVMQQLFDGAFQEQDGKLVFLPPTLRFKADDGSEFPNWGKKLFSNCFEFFTTNSLSREKLSYDAGIVKNIHYGDIHTKFRSVLIPVQETIPYITSSKDTEKFKDTSYCKDGDLVFADASEDYADVGKCIEIADLYGEKVVAGLHTLLARPKQKFAIGFNAYLQKSWGVRYQIMRVAQGTKVLSLSAKQLGSITIPVPCYEEQKKIAAVLMSLDAKIELVDSEIKKTTEWKKGLLQQMFV